ncbi:MAG: PAS domain S-box protein [Bacteroidota bacterium]
MNRSFRIGIGVFVTVLLLTQFLAFQAYKISEIEESQTLVDVLNTISERLKKTLSYSLSASHTLAFIVEQYGVPDDFESLARNILSSYEYIDALELTKEGVITHVFPFEENKQAIGLDVFLHPIASEEARKAVERGTLFFAGPLELVQGGQAIVGRLPMYKNNRFIGFSVTIIKLHTLIRAIGVDQVGKKEFNYQLSKVNPVTEKEEFFLSDSIDKENERVMSVNIADGEWMLYVSPKSSFIGYQQAVGFSILGFILATISGLFSYQWARQPERLNKLVKQKTNELQHEKDLSDHIINSLPGIFFLFDQEGKFYRWNSNLEKFSGYSAYDFKTKRPSDFLINENAGEIMHAISVVFESGEYEIETTLSKKNGEKVPYYLYARRIILENKEYLIGMGFDISDRIHAQEEASIASKEKEITLNRINDSVISLDKDWNYLFINDAALIFFPDGRESALGKNILETSPEIEDTSFWEILKNSMETMTEREFNSYYEPFDRWFSVKTYPSESGMTVFYRDVTNTKKIEEKTMKMIGRELHDNVVQVLTGAGLFLNIGIKKLSNSNGELEKVDELIKKGIEEIRMLSHDLISPFLQGETLENSVKEIFINAGQTSGFDVEFKFIDFKEELLSEKLKTSTYRVVQEQCNNIIKYASPTQVVIRFNMDEEHFEFSIKDDGVGFDPGVRSDGIGFINIQSRIALFNGKFRVISSPGNGCEIQVSFPLPEQLVV